QVGRAADVPARERRLAVVAHRLAGPLPVDEARLFGPERVALGDRAAIEVGIAGHRCLLLIQRIACGASDSALTVRPARGQGLSQVKVPPAARPRNGRTAITLTRCHDWLFPG